MEKEREGEGEAGAEEEKVELPPLGSDPDNARGGWADLAVAEMRVLSVASVNSPVPAPRVGSKPSSDLQTPVAKTRGDRRIMEKLKREKGHLEVVSNHRRRYSNNRKVRSMQCLMW